MEAIATPLVIARIESATETVRYAAVRPESHDPADDALEVGSPSCRRLLGIPSCHINADPTTLKISPKTRT